MQQPYLCRNIKTIDVAVVVVVAIVVTLIIVTAKNPANGPGAAVSSKAARIVTLYYSLAQKTKYCDGAKNDSAGYAKTIVQKLDLPIPETAQAPEAQFSYLINAGVKRVGATYSCPDFFVKDLRVKFVGPEAYLFSPGGGWAGVSIAMCTCTPFLEDNLRQSFGIVKTSWLNSQAEFDAVK